MCHVCRLHVHSLSEVVPSHRHRCQLAFMLPLLRLLRLPLLWGVMLPLLCLFPLPTFFAVSRDLAVVVLLLPFSSVVVVLTCVIWRRTLRRGGWSALIASAWSSSLTKCQSRLNRSCRGSRPRDGRNERRVCEVRGSTIRRYSRSGDAYQADSRTGSSS